MKRKSLEITAKKLQPKIKSQKKLELLKPQFKTALYIFTVTIFIIMAFMKLTQGSFHQGIFSLEKELGSNVLAVLYFPLLFQS